jgi:hypothetical protein
MLTAEQQQLLRDYEDALTLLRSTRGKIIQLPD